MNWTAMFNRSGVVVESMSDDFGTMGVPGTWYRVTDETGRELLTTRNHCEAFRLYQQRASLASGV